MKQQVLTFYTKLLGRIRQPLLPHINVHRPVQVSIMPVLNYSHIQYLCLKLLYCVVYAVFLNMARTMYCAICYVVLSCHSPQKMVRLCGEVLAAPTENEEIQFLCTVCAKLKQDPYLVNFFLEVSIRDVCGSLDFGQSKNGLWCFKMLIV